MRKAIEPMAESHPGVHRPSPSGGAGRRHTAVRYLEQVSPEVAAFITLRVCLDGMSKQRPTLTETATDHRPADRGRGSVPGFLEAHKAHFERTLKFIDRSRHYGYRAAVS